MPNTLDSSLLNHAHLPAFQRPGWERNGLPAIVIPHPPKFPDPLWLGICRVQFQALQDGNTSAEDLGSRIVDLANAWSQHVDGALGEADARLVFGPAGPDAMDLADASKAFKLIAAGLSEGPLRNAFNEARSILSAGAGERLSR